MKEKVAIIGSGLGGMASAIRLKSRGYDVTVFEKNHQVGGKMGEIHAQGYRYDTGPSVFTMPGLVDQLFNDWYFIRCYVPYKSHYFYSSSSLTIFFLGLTRNFFPYLYQK